MSYTDTMGKSIFFLSIIILLSGAYALPSPENTYVNDFASILNSDDALFVHYLFEGVEQNTSAQVVFVSVENAEGYTPSEYATMIGQQWGVGAADTDNGIFILYVKDVGKLWVSTGYGVEGILPDSKVGRMLDTYYVPWRDEGNVSEGIVQFSIALADELEANRDELISTRSPKINWLLIILVIIFVIIIFSWIARHSQRSIWWAPIFIPGSRSGGGGFGGGFGGGGFGGGGAGR